MILFVILVIHIQGVREKDSVHYTQNKNKNKIKNPKLNQKTCKAKTKKDFLEREGGTKAKTRKSFPCSGSTKLYGTVRDCDNKRLNPAHMRAHCNYICHDPLHIHSSNIMHS